MFLIIHLPGPNKWQDNRQKLRFHRNNLSYKLLISIAVLLYDNSAIDEESGALYFKDFFQQDYMHKVFECFILNFYTTHLNRNLYRVYAPKIRWPIDESAAELWNDLFDVDDNPGDRRTDIVVENKDLNLQIIIDAKYYKNTFVSSYMNAEEFRTRTAHLNQVRGYMLDSEFTGDIVGTLVYPMVNFDLTKGTVHPIEQTPIIVKTLNLNDEWSNIEHDLLDYISRIETVLKTSRSKLNQ